MPPCPARPAKHVVMLPARSYAVDRSGALINLTGDGNLLADVAPAVQRFMAALPAPRPASARWGKGGWARGAVEGALAELELPPSPCCGTCA